MSNDSTSPGNSRPGSGEANPADEAAGPASNAAEGQASSSEAAVLRSELEETRARLDRALRAYAEADNIRKRLEREKEEAAKYAVTRFARDIVAVSDNFQRAIASAPTDVLEQDTALKAFLDGIKLTERELLGALERHGVRRIDPLGEQFNPRQHQAMMEVDDATVENGVILQVFQPGYIIEDRVLRPAMVVVAKGGIKPAKGDAAGGSQPPANDDQPADEPGSDPSANDKTGTSEA
jgi:molecular chaperone GrpE